MLTIYDWFGYELTEKERYQRIKEAGFDGVLMWWSDLLNRPDYRSAPQTAREAGLFVENIHAPFQIQAHLPLDNLDGEACLQCYLQCIADCAEFDIPTVVIHLPDDDEQPCNALMLDRVREMGEKAERLGVHVALENVRNLRNLTSIMEQADFPSIGFCYDCSHHYHYYPEVDFLAQYGSRMVALHLHDYIESAHLLPFDGVIDWPTAMKRIEKAGYRGPTALEPMTWGYEDVPIKTFLSNAFEKAKRLDALRYSIV